MRNIKYIQVSVALIASSIFFSCDKVDSPYGDTQSTPGGNGNTVVQKVLLEDFTGAHCTNCPDAHKVAAQLKDLYGDRLVVMGVHVGVFALPGVWGPLYTYDFRTQTGNDLYAFFLNNNEPLPTGMANRMAYSGAISLVSGKWGPATAALTAQQAKAGITISNTSYTAGNGAISADVKINAVSALQDQLRLCLYVTEDSIVKPQLDNGVDIPAYLHRHVLRGSLNGTWGDAVATPIAAGDSTQTTISGSLTQTDLVPEHLYLIAILINETTRDVVQVEEQKLIE